MATYALIAKQPLQTKVRERLAQMYPDCRALNENGSAWMIRSSQSTKEISGALFPRLSSPMDKPIPGHVIVRVSSYWGWQPTDFWEWLSAEKAEPEDG